MKTLLKSKTMIALAVAIAATAGCATNAYEQPIPPPAASADSLPACIAPGSDLAQVFKLVRAGVDLNVINNFIANSASSFSLNADQIIALNDAGVPNSLLDKMLDHDRQLVAAAAALPPPPAPATVTTVQTVAPTAPVTVNYFNDTLSPYGSWVDVSGYGRCWRPTTVNYDSGWRPYCDRGHWVYTDCGWYWDSDYAWGATFHYGRWFRDARHGWCWWPETTWAPSWVVWRSGGDDCGWAPLPPLCEYRRDRGFLYRGNSISVGFDFGLDENYFVFVGNDRFFDRDVRRHREEPQRVTQIFRNTTIVNNYNYGSQNNVVVNNGLAAERFHGLSHQPVQAVAVNTVSNARRDGWRGGAHGEQSAGGTMNSADSSSLRQPGAAPNGQRGHGISTKDSVTPLMDQGRPLVNNGVKNSNSQNADASGANAQSSHTSRLEQMRSHQPNQAITPSVTTTAPQPTTLKVEPPQVVHPVTPAQTGAVLDNGQTTRSDTRRNGWGHNNTPANNVIVTTPPQRTQLPVQQPQVIHPVTPAQTGAVLDNGQATRSEMQRGGWGRPAANQYINTAPPQRSELPVQSPQFQRPVSSGMVLPTASGHMEQRVVQQQTENRFGEARSHAAPPAQAPEIQHSAPAPVQQSKTAESSDNSSSQGADNSRSGFGRHRQ